MRIGMIYMEYIEQSITTFTTAIHNIVKFLKEADEDKLWQQPSEEEWSVMQIASHVAEAIPFWTADVKHLLIVPEGKWGRNHEHVGRLAAVHPTVVQQLKVDEVCAQLEALIPEVTAVLKNVKEEDVERVAPSYNPNFENKPMRFIIDALIVNHAKNHYDQMIRHYEKVK